ncbi:hypothetical protein BBJ29_001720 [Phytophthora kernoviae]|uniref:Cohesin subunit SCC3/SA HEAT-repeats domain-containing protein n=1 Tax=Phytophthora kernoviae TaxID=325452 RepID=A0A3F2RMX4_9STRA|nr:hypothetical protein BBJ29_001720 [Phytophthora kernoviae]RLN60776.1 hypothetical protein BBP00_00005780 [Phytophthora kernoviae]
MSARRSTRLRRKPTPVYQVEDTRTSADEADGEAEAHEALQDAEDAEDSSSDGGLEGDDEEFNPLKTKPKTPKKARTPSIKPKPEAAAESDNDEDADNSLYEVITRGKKPLESLLVEWRDRFEIDEESATREVLNFVLQACGGTGQCVPEAEPLAQLEMSDLVDHVVEDLEKTNGDYPIASRGKGMKKFHRSFEDFWEVFVKECYENIELQPVEKLVFDADHEDIRKAAAEFVCLQYDAFGVAVSKTKDAKLKKEQLNTQAIALVEFAEEYIQNHAIPESAVEILVDAFWGLDDCLVLQDWRLMTNLLLVDKSAPDLSSEQQTILLRLLVASVSKLVGNNAAHPAAKKEAEVLLEEITVAYCKDIPSLFLLYQADSDKLLLLLQLIPMLTLKAEVIGHHSGPIKGLLEKLKHAAEQRENEESNGPEPASSMEELVFEDDSVASYVKEAQRFAFLTFCDARCLFVEKFQGAMPPYNAMEWTLPKVLVLLTQRHFENEMEEADEEEPEFEDDGAEDNLATGEKADAIRAWDEKQQQKAELLVALCRVSLCNPSKKQQAAVVLQHFTSSGKSSVEVVKAFGKRVKTDAPVRYLEIQMTALRQMFNVLLIWKQDLEEATRNENHTAEEVLEQDDLKEKVERCEQEMKELAKRFSQSLGVGKIASSLRLPFLRFLREGVRYSLQQPAQFEFLEAMRGYLSHLDKPSMAQLREYFMECLGALRDIPDDSEGLDPRLSSA